MARAVLAKKHVGRGLKLVAIIAAVAVNPGVPDAKPVSNMDENIAVPERAVIPQETNIQKLIDGLKAVDEKDWTESQKLLSQRIGRERLEGISQMNEQGRNFFRNACIVEDPWKAEAMDRNVMVLPVRSEDKGSYLQAFHIKPEIMDRLRSWLLGISNEHIRGAFPDRAEELILMKTTSPNDYIRHAVVQLANANPQIRQTVFRWGDENHPLWNEDLTMKKELLPEGYTTVHYKGSGEGPIAIEDLHLVNKVMDSYWYKKSERITPLDRRYLATELDMTKTSMGFFIEYTLRVLKGVRPTDLDKDYASPLEKDVPFADSTAWTPDAETMARVHKDFLVKDILIGQILGDVPRQDRPAPIFSRNELMEFGFKAKLVKTFVEGGDRPETTGKNTVQQQAD